MDTLQILRFWLSNIKLNRKVIKGRGGGGLAIIFGGFLLQISRDDD